MRSLASRGVGAPPSRRGGFSPRQRNGCFEHPQVELDPRESMPRKAPSIRRNRTPPSWASRAVLFQRLPELGQGALGPRGRAARRSVATEARRDLSWGVSHPLQPGSTKGQGDFFVTKPRDAPRASSGGPSSLRLSGFSSWDLLLHSIATLSPRPAATVASLWTPVEPFPVDCTSSLKGSQR